MSSSCGLAGLKYVDGLGELSDLPGAAEEFAQDAPGFELGVGAFARAAEPGVSPLGVFLGGWARTWLAPRPARSTSASTLTMPGSGERR